MQRKHAEPPSAEEPAARCFVCRRGFTRPANMRRHMRAVHHAHHAEAPPRGYQAPAEAPGRQLHPCDLCANLYSSRRSMLRHLFYVHGALWRGEHLAFECRMCKRLYEDRADRDLHETHVHVAPPPRAGRGAWRCPYCVVRLSSLYNLRRHLYRRHGLASALPERPAVFEDAEDLADPIETNDLRP